MAGSAQPDTNNSVECVYIKVPQAGEYTIDVNAASVTTASPQKFSVVVTGALNTFEIYLNDPQTGANITAGSAYDVNWTTVGGASPVNVDIFFSNDSGASYKLVVASLPPSGDYSWNVPPVNITTARIKIVATDKNSNVTSDESGDFNITAAAVTEYPAVFISVAAVSFIIAIVLTPRTRRRKTENFS